MCVGGETATPRTPRLVAGNSNDSTRLKPCAMSYTLTGPSLKTYSSRRRPRDRLTVAVGAERAASERRAPPKASTETRS